MTTSDALNARDLRTVACMPLSPYRCGWEDARYQRIYHNPYKRDSDAYRQYNAGHQDGMCGAPNELPVREEREAV